MMKKISKEQKTQDRHEEFSQKKSPWPFLWLGLLSRSTLRLEGPRRLHGAEPAIVSFRGFFFRHLGLEFLRDRMVRLDVSLRVVEPAGEAGEISGPEGGGLEAHRQVHLALEDVALELHEEVVRARPAIDAQSAQLEARFPLHRLDDVLALVGDGFEARAGDVMAFRTAGEAEDRASCLVVPPRGD